MIYVLLPVWQTEFARCSLAHFRIDAEFGEGGMGVVYRATDQHHQLVAPKTQTPNPSSAACPVNVVLKAA